MKLMFDPTAVFKPKPSGGGESAAAREAREKQQARDKAKRERSLLAGQMGADRAGGGVATGVAGTPGRTLIGV